jgi:hypothetical protein
LQSRWWGVERLFAFRRRLEELEDRTVPTLVTWDGGAGTFNWLDDANWDTNAPPGPADDVVIPDLSGTPTIASNGAVSIRSLASAEALLVNGGSFSVLNPPTLSLGVHVAGGAFLPNNGLTSTNGLSVESGTTTAMTNIPTAGLASLARRRRRGG